MKKMTGKKCVVFALAVFLYLAVGWNIGQIKYDLWHGKNGYAALKNLEKAKNPSEDALRKYFFPWTFDCMAAGDTSDEPCPKPPFILMQWSGDASWIYNAIHSVIGPVFSIFWAFIFNVVYISIAREFLAITIVGGIYLAGKIIFKAILGILGAVLSVF